ncbi:MAG: class I SAM-dependent methyltransferase [Deltaproteobacteria bacterium]|nr:class I SAM-dependent methyltransferase [Deltaproteobacteria bacterium]
MPINLKRDFIVEQESISLNPGLLKDIFSFAKPFGHNEDAKNLNLGFGFLYYGLARTLRPQHTLVIGSGYGFSVVCFALGIKDNGKGNLSFIDPSYSLLKDGPFKTIGGVGFWDDETKVKSHFQRFEVDHLIRHYKMRSDEFFPLYESMQLAPIDLAFIDGSHAYKDVRYDFIKVLERSKKNTYILLHDSNIYIREILQHSGVKKWLNTITVFKEFFEVIDFPFSSGVALVRVRKATAWKHVS